MASLNIPYSFTNGTIANATEVNAVMNSIKAFVESETVQRDGSVKATLNSLADSIVRALVPVGTIAPFAGATAPVGWLLCNGTATTGYPLLSAMVGASTPNLAGRTLIGAGTGSGLTARSLNATGGAETHLLTAAESGVPAHSHGITDPGHNHTYKVNFGNDFGATPIWEGSVPFGEVNTGTKTTGITINNNTAQSAASAHNNMQPFHVVNFIIKHD